MKRADILETLHQGFTHSVNDALWGSIPFTRELKDILRVESVQKLARIKQLGPTHHIYPGALHSRLDHSVGVYHLCREILISLAIKNDELPLTRSGILSFLVSGLLHDIGHFPYAHSLKELALREHEEIAATLIKEDRVLNAAIVAAGADPETVRAIIDKDIVTDRAECLLYRNILSGTLDPDKLDYLSRDAFFTGVPYGIQNPGYIISALNYRDGEIVLEEKALVAVENILFSKYSMYKVVYWHKGTRCATAMIKKALLSALRDGVITFEDLYLKDDEEFNILGRSHRGYEPFELIDMVDRNQFLERRARIELEENPGLTRMAMDLGMRGVAEDRIYEILKRKYPQLKRHLVIVDLPEPITFETRMKLLRVDGTVSEIREDETVFSSHIGKKFTDCLRKIWLFMPSYVTFEDAEKAWKEADFEH